MAKNPIFATLTARQMSIIEKEVPNKSERCDLLEYMFAFQYAKKKGMEASLPSIMNLSPSALKALNLIGGRYKTVKA